MHRRHHRRRWVTALVLELDLRSIGCLCLPSASGMAVVPAASSLYLVRSFCWMWSQALRSTWSAFLTHRSKLFNFSRREPQPVEAIAYGRVATSLISGHEIPSSPFRHHPRHDHRPEVPAARGSHAKSSRSCNSARCSRQMPWGLVASTAANSHHDDPGHAETDKVRFADPK